MNFACGYAWRSWLMRSWEKISCTIHAPFHSTISLPVFFFTYSPRFLSGPNMIFSSGGKLSTICTALLDVHTISLKAFNSAVQLTYVMTVCPGYCSLNLANRCGGQLSEREQPALRSGSNTFF